jgi:hypothetical protein
VVLVRMSDSVLCAGFVSCLLLGACGSDTSSRGTPIVPAQSSTLADATTTGVTPDVPLTIGSSATTSAVDTSLTAANSSSTAATMSASTSAAPTITRGRYRWQGMVWGTAESDDAKACFGPILASNPPAGCDGWPLREFDWATAPYYQLRSRDNSGPAIRTSTAELVGTFDGSAFLLTEPPRPVAQPLAPLPCEAVTGAPGNTTRQQAVTALNSEPARRAGVWLQSNDAIAMIPEAGKIDLLVVDELTRTWIHEHLLGMSVEVCPVLRPA